MSHVMLYSAVSSGEGGVKVALYTKTVSPSTQKSITRPYLLEVGQQALPTPARVTDFLPGIVV